MRLSLRLGKLEAAAASPFDPRDRRLAVIRGPIAEAESLPARFGLVAAFPWPVVVTERGWKGKPRLLSPLCTLGEMSDRRLRVLESLYCPNDATGVALGPDTVVVPCVVELEAA